MSATWIAKLFAVLQARYGHKMSSAYPTAIAVDNALDEWARGLADMSGEDIARGLKVWQEDWPPSLPEFVRACKPAVTIAAHRAFGSLPKPVPDKALGAKAFAEMHKVLCG